MRCTRFLLGATVCILLSTLAADAGASRREIIAKLSSGLRSADARERLNAAFVLIPLQPRKGEAAIDIFRGPEIVAVLVEGMKHEDKEIRTRAAALVRSLGDNARLAVPALLERLEDKEAEVREQAALSLQNHPANNQIAFALRRLLEKGNAPVRAAALSVLGSSRFDLRAQAVPDLIHALKDNDAEVRKIAASSLASIGPDAKTALANVSEAAFRDPNLEVRRGALWAMIAIGPESLGDIIEILDSRDTALHRDAIVGLGKHGKTSQEAVQALARIVRNKDADYDLRYSAVAMLRDIGPLAKAAVLALEGLRNYRALQMRMNVEEALRTIQGR